MMHTFITAVRARAALPDFCTLAAEATTDAFAILASQQALTSPIGHR